MEKTTSFMHASEGDLMGKDCEVEEIKKKKGFVLKNSVVKKA